MRALGTKDWLLVRRALFEAVPLVSSHPELAKAVLHNSPYSVWNVKLNMLAIRALGNARGESAEEVIRAYRQFHRDRRPAFLAVLGRMGDSARSAGPALRERLAEPSVQPDEQMAIRVVLACIGQATQEELEEIAASVERRDSLEVIANTMCVIGRNDWVRGRLKFALIQALKQSDDEDKALNALMALATLGPEASEEVRLAMGRRFDANVRQYESETGARSDMGVVMAGLWLAVVDPARRREALRTVFVTFEGAWLTRELFSIPDQLVSAVRDERFTQEVVSLVSDPDPHLATQAAYFLQVIGPPARAATPALLGLIQDASSRDSNKEARLRIAAAEALGMVAMPSDLSRIRALSQEPGLPPDLKQALEQSIRVIQLGD